MCCWRWNGRDIFFTQLARGDEEWTLRILCFRDVWLEENLIESQS
jgi:hypothetical protein